MATLLKAKARAIRVVIVSIIIALMIVESSGARLSPAAGFSTTPEKIDARRITLREVQVKIFGNYQRRLARIGATGATTQRVAPGGPDSQHH